jgi:hypothetical protein
MAAVAGSGRPPVTARPSARAYGIVVEGCSQFVAELLNSTAASTRDGE